MFTKTINIVFYISLTMPSERNILREYRATLDKMGIRTWAGFLDKDWWTREYYKGDPVYGNGKYYGKQEHNSANGTCNVCGHRIDERYVGSHFRQCHTKLAEHQKAVRLYYDLLKRTLSSILKKYGYRLKENPEEGGLWSIWETARKCLRDGLYRWDRAIEPIRKDMEE